MVGATALLSDFSTNDYILTTNDYKLICYLSTTESC